MIGYPIRVNVGGRALKEGKVEVVSRRDRAYVPWEGRGGRDRARAPRGAREEASVSFIARFGRGALEYHSRGRKGKSRWFPQALPDQEDSRSRTP